MLRQWGNASSLEHGLNGIVVSVERAVTYPGEHPNARQLEESAHTLGLY